MGGGRERSEHEVQDDDKRNNEGHIFASAKQEIATCQCTDQDGNVHDHLDCNEHNLSGAADLRWGGIAQEMEQLGSTGTTHHE
jgi:hypothetical protein